MKKKFKIKKKKTNNNKKRIQQFFRSIGEEAGIGFSQYSPETENEQNAAFRRREERTQI